MLEQLDVNEDTITEDEAKRAIRKHKNNNAAGADQITDELLKHCGNVVSRGLTKLINCCWKEQQIPEGWRKGTIVKLSTKGNLTDCNNWRGITSL